MDNANATTVRQFYDTVWNQGNTEAIDRFISPDYVGHVPSQPNVEGVAGVRQLVEAFRTGFPDRTVHAEEILTVDPDRAVSRWTSAGTHLGPFMGIAPTGRRVELSGITIIRFSEGKFVETWDEYDELGLLRQIET